jgi:tetraacyldisaccharide 4'-kinase
MAGIGRPEKFFETLEATGARIVGTKTFGDHHRYSEGELTALKRRAAEAGALLVTTEKDLVRIEAKHRDRIMALPIDAVFATGGELSLMLDRLVQGQA